MASGLSQMQIEKATALYEQGETFYSIAQSIHSSPGTVRDTLNRRGINSKTRAAAIRLKQDREKARRERAIRLYHDGWSLYKIFISTGISYGLLRKLLPEAFTKINDLGKVGALWHAGWNLDMIAEEFKTTNEDAARAVRKILLEREVNS